MDRAKEISRRRTFAIVSHPDAGKTTLTEKLLLYGGAVQMAGSVTARRKERATVSDWLEIERKRGISVTSTVLYFDYNGYRINLLDTPGHNDFSEDTYRVLTAVDSVVMVIDGGKGIERQTIKLCEVCKRRGIPIITFVNKMDRPALDTLSLLDDIEKVVSVGAWPVNIPLGSGVDFRGVWDRRSKMVHLFERTVGGAYRAPVVTCGLDDPQVRKLLPDLLYATIQEEVAMIEHAGADFSDEAVASGAVTPVFFGSAVNNFGIQLLLDGFLDYSPPPQPRRSGEVVVAPESDFFSGFVFKIQANLDARHRDRMAYLRIVSGKFTRDMHALHTRTGKKIRLANASNVFGRERISVDDGYPGDVIGVVGGDQLTIGDTLSEQAEISYAEVPRFPPECFSYIHNPHPSNYKKFRKGIEQLVQEGLVHLFTVDAGFTGAMVLGAVGPLQFDLVHYRLESEYSVVTRMEKAPWTIARWLAPVEGTPRSLSLPIKTVLAKDRSGNDVLLFEGEWALRYFTEHHSAVVLLDTPPGGTVA